MTGNYFVDARVNELNRVRQQAKLLYQHVNNIQVRRFPSTTTLHLRPDGRRW